MAKKDRMGNRKTREQVQNLVGKIRGKVNYERKN